MALPSYISVADYLALDDHSRDARYEYLDGELRMLAGGNSFHSMIKTNLTGILYGLLRKKSCRVFDSDLRLQLSPTRYVYPDITISCDPLDRQQNKSLHSPRVIIEVLSASTEVVDRIKKLAYYREYPTIEEYVLVDSRKIQVEIYRREGNKWTLYSFDTGDMITLTSIDVEFSMDDVYEDIHFTEIDTENAEDL